MLGGLARFLWAPVRKDLLSLLSTRSMCFHHRCDLCHQGKESMEAECAARFPLTHKSTWKVFSQVQC